MLAQLTSLNRSTAAQAIAHAQKYLTLHGPGRNFHLHPNYEAFPFMLQGLNHAYVWESYRELVIAAAEDALLDPQYSPHGGRHQFRNVPYNLTRTTVYTEPLIQGIRPTIANVEFVGASHRQAPDVSVTLWDGNYTALCTSLISGPRAGTDRPRNSDWEKYILPHRVDARIEAAQKRLDNRFGLLMCSPIEIDAKSGKLFCYAQLDHEAEYSLTQTVFTEFIQELATHIAESLPQVYHLVQQAPKCNEYENAINIVNTPFPTPLCFVASDVESCLHYRSRSPHSEYKTPAHATQFGNLLSRSSVSLARFQEKDTFKVLFSHLHVYDQHYPVPPWDSEIGQPFLPPQTPCLTFKAEFYQNMCIQRGTYYFVPR